MFKEFLKRVFSQKPEFSDAEKESLDFIPGFQYILVNSFQHQDWTVKIGRTENVPEDKVLSAIPVLKNGLERAMPLQMQFITIQLITGSEVHYLGYVREKVIKFIFY